MSSNLWNQFEEAHNSGDIRKENDLVKRIKDLMESQAQNFINKTGLPLEHIVLSTYASLLLASKKSQKEVIWKTKFLLLSEFVKKKGLRIFSDPSELLPYDLVVLPAKTQDGYRIYEFKGIDNENECFPEGNWIVWSIDPHRSPSEEAIKIPKKILGGIHMPQTKFYFFFNLNNIAMEITGFENAIKIYLDDYAQKDEAFAAKYKNPNKSVEECCKYIMKEVEKTLKEKKNCCVPVKNEEVYSMAIHYFDEDDLQVEELESKCVTTTEAQSSDKSTSEEKPKKARKPRTKKAVVAEVTDENIPEPLTIPIF